MELGGERSQRRVSLIDGADSAVELELAAGREIGGDGDWKLGNYGKVGGSNVDVVVCAELLRIRRAEDDAAVLELKLFDGEVGWRTRRTRGFRGRSLAGLRLGTERGIVPEAGGVVKEGHLRAINGDAGDVQGLREYQRNHFNTDLKGLGGEERRRTEFGIVADGKIFGGERTAEQR